MMEYKRNCPSCSRGLFYSSRRNFVRAVKRNGVCFTCNLTNNKFSCGSRSLQTKRKMRLKKLGKPRPKWVRLKISKSKCGVSTATEKSREMLRVARLNQIKRLGMGKMYNPKACQFIDLFGKKSGYNFRHALNGGEVVICGYSVDGYDSSKNVIFEYDESQHHQLNRKQKDLIRQKRIIARVNPSCFFRYDERNKRLYDVMTQI